MRDTTPAPPDPRHDPSRRLLLRVPAEHRFLPVLATACRIYCNALPGGRHLHPLLAQAVIHLFGQACSDAAAQVDLELRVAGSRLEVAAAHEVVGWEIGEVPP